MDDQVLVFLALVGVMALYVTLELLLDLMRTAHSPLFWLTLLSGPLMLLFVVGMLRIFQWLSGGGERLLLAAIQSALRKEAPAGGAPSASRRLR